MSDHPIDTPNDTTIVSKDWRNNLPQNVQAWQEVQTSDSPEKFWSQVENMRSRMGQSIRIPGKDAGAEQLNEFYGTLQARVPGLMRSPDPEDEGSIEQVMRSLGKPDDEKGYELGDDVEVSENELHDLRAMAKEIGMTKRQFKKFAKNILGVNRSQIEAANQRLTSEQNALKSDWGAAYDERMNDILNIAEATGASESLLSQIKNKTIDRSTAKWLHQLGKQLGGEAINAHVQDKTMAPQEANESIDEILGNKDHPYWNAHHPGHKAAVDKVIKLHRLANGQAVGA